VNDGLITDAFGYLASLIGEGLLEARPDPDYLNGKSNPDLSNVWIRSKGLICQGREEQQGKCVPGQGDCYHDGGDSSQKTGIAAFSNSDLDKGLMPRFMLPGATMLCRNPDQEEWSDPKKTSRDQLIQYAAGCWRARQTGIVEKLLDGIDKVSPGYGRVNGDILLPHNMMFLRACAGQDTRLDLNGHFFLTAAIELDNENEINGLVAQSIVCGHLDHFVLRHSNYRKLIEDYWGSPAQPWADGRKGQPEIGEAFIRAIDLELQRYDGSFLVKLYPTLRRLFRAALGDIPTYAEFARHLYERFKDDPKGLLFMLLGADPKAAVGVLELFVRDYAAGLARRWEDAVAIADAVRSSFGDFGLSLDAGNCRPKLEDVRPPFRSVILAATKWHEAEFRSI
jgi:hypothetical protein